MPLPFNPQTALAFPSGPEEIDGLTVRDYFAARAPREPWPWFKPALPPRPTQPANLPRGVPEESALGKYLGGWAADPCWDLEDDPRIIEHVDADAVLAWAKEWKRHDAEYRAYALAERDATVAQWPWAWADAVLAARGGA